MSSLRLREGFKISVSVGIDVGRAQGIRFLSGQGQQCRCPFRDELHQEIDIAVLAFLTARNASTPVPGLASWKGFTPARAVEGLDRVGIATAMLSLTAPGGPRGLAIADLNGDGALDIAYSAFYHTPASAS